MIGSLLKSRKRLCDLKPCPVVFVCILHDYTRVGRKLNPELCADQKQSHIDIMTRMFNI